MNVNPPSKRIKSKKRKKSFVLIKKLYLSRVFNKVLQCNIQWTNKKCINPKCLILINIKAKLFRRNGRMKWLKSWKEFIIGRCFVKLSRINFRRIIMICRNSIIRISSSRGIMMGRCNRKSRKLIKKLNRKWILNKKVFVFCKYF